MAEGDIKIDSFAAFRQFASGIEQVREGFRRVGTDTTQLALRPSGGPVQTPWVDRLFFIQGGAAIDWAAAATVVDRGFNGIKHMALNMGVNIETKDADHGRKLFDDAHAAVPRPRAELPSTDPAFKPNFIDRRKP